MSPARNAHNLTETDIWCYSLCELIQISGGSFKNSPINEAKTSFLNLALFH